MLRALSIRDFVVIAALDIELEPGFTALTGETGAGKSMLVDALQLLLGDRFELRQLREGAERAELSAVFDLAGVPAAAAWLGAAMLDEGAGEVILRRTLDAQGRSRAWINGHPATLSQLAELGELLVDVHGQHAHQALSRAPVQRELVDAFGGFTTLAREVAESFRAWRTATGALEAAQGNQDAAARERTALEAVVTELEALAPGEAEWAELGASQTRLANAASLIDTASAAQEALDGDDGLMRSLASLQQRVAQAAQHDRTLDGVVAAMESARNELGDAAHSLRDYLRRLDVDPAELARVESRLSALHDAARKHRVRPEELPGLAASTRARLAALDESVDLALLRRRADTAFADYDELARTLSAKRRLAATELSTRVTAALQGLSMQGGRFEARLVPAEAPAAHGRESIEFDVAAHAAQSAGPLSKVASGGELARIALAIQVAASEVGGVPTLVFDEVDSGIGGAVAATVGGLLQSLASRRQVLCVTHLAQVAAHADHHFVVRKSALRGKGRAKGMVASEVEAVEGDARVDEIARMMSGAEVTAATRAHARELRDASRRPPAARAARRRAG